MTQQITNEISLDKWHITWQMAYHVTNDATNYEWHITWQMAYHVTNDATNYKWHITWQMAYHVTNDATNYKWHITWQMTYHVTSDALDDTQGDNVSRFLFLQGKKATLTSQGSSSSVHDYANFRPSSQASGTVCILISFSPLEYFVLVS